MTLVIAFIGMEGAVMAGDMREITFQGNKDRREMLEKELYSGAIITDEELEKRANDLGIKITVRDDKNKVSQQDGVLMGEVSSIEEGSVKKRRLYACADSYAIADIIDSKVELKGKGKSTNFVVLGNDITKKITNQCIKDNWKNGNLRDAIKIIILSMEVAARMTASVSKNHILLQTTSKADISKLIDQTIKDNE